MNTGTQDGIETFLRACRPHPANSAQRVVEAYFDGLRPSKVRSYRQFAEEELVLPTGPRAGLRFRCDYMPFSGLILDEFSRGHYRRFFGSGNVQCSKTLLFFLIPFLYHVFELEEPVIIGVPKMDIAQGIYEERIRPAVLATRYADLLPRTGSGSRGGKFIAATMGNGVTVRFMAGGGGDEQRASFTAPVVILTEIDKMDRPGAVSREADPVSQLEARNSAFGAAARLYGECTMSIEEGRIHQEISKFGTDTHIHIPCPGCGEYIAPERDQFVGWQDAENVMQAREQAAFVCPECSVAWTETQRLAALRHPVLVSAGQVVTPAGQVEGDPPQTNTFGVRWNGMHSVMISMADIAEREYRAEQSDNPEDMRAVFQFLWALPWKDALLNLSRVNRDLVLSKIGDLPRGVAPKDTARLTVFIDLGLYRCWWAAWAWRENAEGFCIDYGALEVPQARQTNPLAILASLRAFRDEVLEPGWVCAGKPIRHDLCLIDSGYQLDVAYAFVRESGQGRYLASKGLGTAKTQDGWRSLKPGKGRQIGNDWMIVRQPNGIRLVSMHADGWKKAVHEGFAAPMGTPGSLQLHRGELLEHRNFARQIVSERQEEEFVPGRGSRVYWNKVARDNHWFDCTDRKSVV